MHSDLVAWLAVGFIIVFGTALICALAFGPLFLIALVNPWLGLIELVTLPVAVGLVGWSFS